MAPLHATSSPGSMSTSRYDNHSSSSALAASRASLFTLAAVLPWVTTNLTWTGLSSHPLTANTVELPRLLVVLICLVVGLTAWSVSLFGHGPEVRGNRAAYLVLFALLTVLGISTLFSNDRLISALGRDPRYSGLVTYSAFIAAFFLASQVLQSDRDRRRFGWLLVVSSAGVSLYALVQYLGWDPVDWGVTSFGSGRSFATFGNPLILGGFLVAPLAISLGLAVTSEAGAKTLAWSSAALISVAITVTFTRGAWLAALVSVVVLLAALIRGRVSLTKIDAIGAGVMVAASVAVVVLSLGSASVETNVGERLAPTTEVSASSTGARIADLGNGAAKHSRTPFVGYWTGDLSLGVRTPAPGRGCPSEMDPLPWPTTLTTCPLPWPPPPGYRQPCSQRGCLCWSPGCQRQQLSVVG